MEPLVSLTLRHNQSVFLPGDELDCEYQIDAIGERQIQSIENSVMWYTVGKGDEDLGVHHFERRVANDFPDMDLRELHRFKTTCPASPLSYEGEIVKIRWCIRVRVFRKSGKEILFELPFQIGRVPARGAAAATSPERSTKNVR
jgi:hypothetical protein